MLAVQGLHLAIAMVALVIMIVSWLVIGVRLYLTIRIRIRLLL